MLSQFPDGQALDILDLGCGPGRDILYFKSLGHSPVGLDGSQEFCNMARKLTDCEILHQEFLKLKDMKKLHLRIPLISLLSTLAP